MAGPLPESEPAPVDGALAPQASVGAENRSFHAYVHIPFCRVRCGYCDFNTYTATELQGVSQDSFAQTLAAEIDFSKRVIDEAGLPERHLASVFFGGGTPTQLPASDLVALLSRLEQNFGLAKGVEITTEANPDNLTAEYAAQLAEGGFSRISIGMQSAVPSVLRTLDRTHNPQNVAEAVKAAKIAGLQSSVDLIYGAPGESLDDWRISLETALSLEPDHISAYSLIVEDGTKLARQIRSGEVAATDEDLDADKYELADVLLRNAGFEWYELSNWSTSHDTRSVHNLAYWRSNDWWGFGPGAHSHIGGTRWWNVKHPSAYTTRIKSSESPAAAREILDDSVRLQEQVLLEVRIREGLSIERLRSLPGFRSEVIASFIAEGLADPAEALKGTLVLTLKGRLLADALVRQLLD